MTDKESKFEMLFTAMDTTGSNQLQKIWEQKHETDLIDTKKDLSFWNLTPVEEQIPVSIAIPERSTKFSSR